MQIEVQMKETRKLQIESEKRSMKLANELTQVKAENIQLHELLQKAERERDRIQKNYKVLELHVMADFQATCFFVLLKARSYC